MQLTRVIYEAQSQLRSALSVPLSHLVLTQAQFGLLLNSSTV